MQTKYINQKDYGSIHSVLMDNNGIMSRAPGLCYASKQNAAESLPEFYQSRHFTFFTYHRPPTPRWRGQYGDITPFHGLLEWLSKIGLTGRKNIRYLTIRLEEYCPRKHPSIKQISLELIHDQVSDKATVVYQTGQASDLTDKQTLWTMVQNSRKQVSVQCPNSKCWAISATAKPMQACHNRG